MFTEVPTPWKPYMNQYGVYLKEVMDAQWEAHQAVLPIYRKLVDAGYCPRDVSHILSELIGMDEGPDMLRHSLSVRKAEKKGNK